MEDYKNPKMFETTNYGKWEEHKLSLWAYEGQYVILNIMKELNMQNNVVVYNLGKNLWYLNRSEDHIREQLTKYAASKRKNGDKK